MALHDRWERPGLLLQLPVDVGSMPRARREVIRYCSAQGLSTMAETAGNEMDVRQLVALLTTELVANAVLHGGGEQVQVSVDCSPEQVWVACIDISPDPPIVKDVDVEAIGGRGVALIAALATRWGYEPVTPAGKRVWFCLAVSEAA